MRVVQVQWSEITLCVAEFDVVDDFDPDDGAAVEKLIRLNYPLTGEVLVDAAEFIEE